MYTLKAVVGIIIGMILCAGIAVSQGPVTQRNLSLAWRRLLRKGRSRSANQKGLTLQ